MARKSLKKTYRDLMQGLVEEYRAAGNDWPAASITIARWAIRHGKWTRHGTTLAKICARDISKALRDEMYLDPQGRRVRTKHAARYTREMPDGSCEQYTLWADVRTADRKFMEVAFKQRRTQIVSDCKQLKTDVESYNDNGPRGQPIQLHLDFTADVAEAMQPAEYRPSGVDPAIAEILEKLPEQKIPSAGKASNKAQISPPISVSLTSQPQSN
jgi:hypothetical protein